MHILVNVKLGSYAMLCFDTNDMPKLYHCLAVTTSTNITAYQWHYQEHCLLVPVPTCYQCQYWSAGTWDPLVIIFLQILHPRSERPPAGISCVNKSSRLFKPLLNGLNKQSQRQAPSKHDHWRISAQNILHLQALSTENERSVLIKFCTYCYILHWHYFT